MLDDRVRRVPGIRVLASASSNELVEELSRFLDVIRIDVPSLRRRAEDIPLLAERFMHGAAREYARHIGLHSLIVAVQPRWDSPSDLLGHYNFLEQRYRATELSRALWQFDRGDEENVGDNMRIECGTAYPGHANNSRPTDNAGVIYQCI